MPTIQFKGKSFVQNHHLAVPFHQLVPQPDKSLTDKVSLKDNLIIQGDNLLALKALLPTYSGKIDCIYIDPPYNTGNEGWIYNDNVKSPIIKEWIGHTVGKEGEDLTRHDKWLCMMLPRLKLLRELLSDDGAIFVSIDDNEAAHLKVLMDEVFGPLNHVASLIWKSADSSNNDSKQFSLDHNVTQVYSRTEGWKANQLERTEDNNQHYSNPDNDPRGDWFQSNLQSPHHRENLKFTITSPTGKTISPPTNGWRWGKERMDEMIADKTIIFNADGSKLIKKTYLADQKGLAPSSIWDDVEKTGHNRNAKYEIAKIFRELQTEDLFPTPKPSKFIKQILRVATKKDSIILDSFAGSGTTAQAVLEVNKEDGGNRKFILVEMEDYANTITAERVRRVIKGVDGASNDMVKNGLGGTFSYFGLGDPIETATLLSGSKLPSYNELGRYVYYTATGEDFDDSKLDEDKNYVGTSSQFTAYMYYKPNVEYLKSTALTLDEARKLRSENGDKPLLVFAPTKYVEQTELDNLKITFCQLPFEIYKVK